MNSLNLGKGVFERSLEEVGSVRGFCNDLWNLRRMDRVLAGHPVALVESPCNRVPKWSGRGIICTVE